jgi:hypothetical protein
VRLAQRGFRKTCTARYRCAYAESLADVSLEEGDTIPSVETGDSALLGNVFDTTYEILTSERQQDPQSADAIVAVSGYTEVYGHAAKTTADWSEIKGTRQVARETTEFIEWQARYSATTALGTDQYPGVGDVASAVVGTATAVFGSTFAGDPLDAEPQAFTVSLVESQTPLKVHCEVLYRAYFIADAAHTTWKEVRGSRKITADASDYREWTIDFVAATTVASASNGQPYGSVVGVSTQTIGNTALFDTAVLVQVGHVHRLTPNKSFFTGVFRERYLDTTVA